MIISIIFFTMISAGFFLIYRFSVLDYVGKGTQEAYSIWNFFILFLPASNVEQRQKKYISIVSYEDSSDCCWVRKNRFSRPGRGSANTGTAVLPVGFPVTTLDMPRSRGDSETEAEQWLPLPRCSLGFAWTEQTLWEQRAKVQLGIENNTRKSLCLPETPAMALQVQTNQGVLATVISISQCHWYFGLPLKGEF